VVADSGRVCRRVSRGSLAAHVHRAEDAVSRTRRRGKGAGTEFWSSRLHTHGETPGRYTKTRTHRYERRMNGRGVRRYSQRAQNVEESPHFVSAEELAFATRDYVRENRWS
jgi:hypothetical protein